MSLTIPIPALHGRLSNSRLLREIHDAAVACLSSAAESSPTAAEDGSPRLEAVVVQTRGALSMLKRMSSSPELAQLGSKLVGEFPIPPSSSIINHQATTIEPACINWQSHQWCSASHHNGDMTTPAILRAPPDPTTQVDAQGRRHFAGVPSGLLLSPEELGIQRVVCRDQPGPGQWYRINRFDAKKSQSTEGLNDLKILFEQRVRHGREERQRRKSFSLGVGAHLRDSSILSDSEEEDSLDPNLDRGKEKAIELFRSRRPYSFTPFTAGSLSSAALGGSQERWPDFVVSKLTNGQQVEARLKMFQYFTGLMKHVDSDESPTTSPESSDTPPRGLPGPCSQRLRLVCGACTIARPGKLNGGEDAYFHNQDGEKFSFAGVADGVGEWGEYDCCPRQFACELMAGSRSEADRLPYYHNLSIDSTRASLRALSVLKAGFARASKAEDCFGSSTSIVAGLDARGETLGVANLGDSSCIVLRRSPHLFRHMTIAKRTREQQHFFNCPYQLSKVPEKKDIPVLEKRGLYALTRVISNLKPGVTTDSPEMASLYDLKVREGDLVILGTDGLFDNLFDSEIIYLASLCLSPYESKLFFRGSSLSAPISPIGSSDSSPDSAVALMVKATANPLSPQLSSARRMTEAWVSGGLPHPLAVEPPITTDEFGIATPPSAVARGLAEAAFYRSLDPRARTPFAKAARSAGCQVMNTGGKMDDITVVACWVVADPMD